MYVLYLSLTRYLSRTLTFRREQEFVVDDDGLGYYDDGEEHLFDRESDRRKSLNAQSQKAGALSMEAIKRARELDAKRKGEKKKFAVCRSSLRRRTVLPVVLSLLVLQVRGGEGTMYPAAAR